MYDNLENFLVGTKVIILNSKGTTGVIVGIAQVYPRWNNNKAVTEYIVEINSQCSSDYKQSMILCHPTSIKEES